MPPEDSKTVAAPTPAKSERMYRIQNMGGPLDLGMVEALDRKVKFGTAQDDAANKLRAERIAAKVDGAERAPERPASFILVTESELELFKESSPASALFDCGNLVERGA